MTEEEIIKQINRYFYDTSRSHGQTARGLEAIIDHTEILHESLDISED